MALPPWPAVYPYLLQADARKVDEVHSADGAVAAPVARTQAGCYRAFLEGALKE
jgi:hypothetical protein